MTKSQAYDAHDELANMLRDALEKSNADAETNTLISDVCKALIKYADTIALCSPAE